MKKPQWLRRGVWEWRGMEVGNDLLLCNKAFKEMRKEWGEKERKEKSSRRSSNKADSTQIANERPTGQWGGSQLGEKKLQQPQGCCESWRKTFAKWECPALPLGSFLHFLSNTNHYLDGILQRWVLPSGLHCCCTQQSVLYGVCILLCSGIPLGQMHSQLPSVGFPSDQVTPNKSLGQRQHLVSKPHPFFEQDFN